MVMIKLRFIPSRTAVRTRQDIDATPVKQSCGSVGVEVRRRSG
jgi:hypothetical protein